MSESLESLIQPIRTKTDWFRNQTNDEQAPLNHSFSQLIQNIKELIANTGVAELLILIFFGKA